MLAAGWACGPEFPSTLIGATDAALMAAPAGEFSTELMRIAPGLTVSIKDTPLLDRENTELRNTVADANDLSSALRKQGVPDPQRQALVLELLDWRRGGLKGPVPAGLPEEFAAYDRGAVKYRAMDMEGARKEWTALLALPEAERQWRTVWASYMIARSYLDTEPARAAALFAETRALAPKGFSDSLGLIGASKGWEARARLDLGQPDAAAALYLEQARAGDPMARWNLADTASEILNGDDKALMTAARDTTTRQLVTAYLVSHPSNGADDSTSKRWMDTLTAAAISDVSGADRLAWVAYQANDVAAAERWLKLGGPQGEGTAVGQWIRAKLALRAGNVNAAAAALANAAAAFPQHEEWNNNDAYPRADLPWKPASHAAGELALLKLGRAQFVDAMDLFSRNGFWTDAAFVAERVLTVNELKMYVDQNLPDEEHAPNLGETFGRVRSLRYLLARRLTRLGQWKVARPYYPVELRPVLDQYITAIRDGHDSGRPASARAASLWEAAKLARSQGMELLGTELGPDESIHGGSFQFDELNSARRLKEAAEPAARKLSPVTAEEQRRHRLPAETIDKRWHYRYTALDHAWSAAQLMPSETDELARLLIESGQWVAAQDPQAADRFYKALVTRCGKTALGKEADRLRWFPPL
jgi:hypothetical protein